MAKEWLYRGKKLEELQKLSIPEFAKLLTSGSRRSLTRGIPEQHKIFLKNLEAGSKNLKTHCRDIIVLPAMVGKTIKIHNGKEFVQVIIEPDMLGHRFGEFAMTRKKVQHSAPGIGATRSSASLSVR